MESQREISIYLYELFYKTVNNYSRYTFTPTDKQNKEIDNFLLKIHKRHNINSIGIDFLLKYFIFQFNRQYKNDYDVFGGKIMLNWIIGKKAWKFWCERNKEWGEHYLHSNFVNDFKISFNEIANKFNNKESFSLKTYNKLIAHEELQKKKGYNTPKGMANCIKFTTLYNSKSILCIGCKYKTECQKLLKTNFPNIYDARNQDR